MMGYLDATPWKRSQPRVPVEAFCSELRGDVLRHAVVVDLSPGGLRIQRPVGGPQTRDIQLEFEIPDIDEIGWAHGEICFDETWRLAPAPAGGLTGLVRTSGIQLRAAANRHRRLLRDYVMDTWARAQPPIEDAWLLQASCYRCG